MKKLFYLFAILTMAFGLTACGSDDNSDNNTQHMKELVGVWSDSRDFSNGSYEHFVWEFKSDGTYIFREYYGKKLTDEMTAKWYNKGNEVFVTDGKESASFNIITIDNDKFTSKDLMDAKGALVTFYRISLP